jgi:hypothetical protein
MNHEVKVMVMSQECNSFCFMAYPRCRRDFPLPQKFIDTPLMLKGSEGEKRRRSSVTAVKGLNSK